MKLSAILAGCALALAIPVAARAQPQAAPHAGVNEVRSRYALDETVARLRADIEAKNIRFFADIDQQALAHSAGIDLKGSRLILFGNPPLGVQFLTASPYAGLDWPVRMLAFENADGGVTVAWTDFAAIGGRYALRDRDAQLRMASEVAASIAGSVTR